MQPEEVGRLAVLSAIKYHRDNKVGNNEVSIVWRCCGCAHIMVMRWAIKQCALSKIILEPDAHKF